jgi:hypothetical protein
MHHPIRPRRSATDLDGFDAIAIVLLTLAIVAVTAAMCGCSWHVAIDTWEGTASSDIDFHLTPAKATTSTTNHRPPRPAPTTTPTTPAAPPAK